MTKNLGIGIVGAGNIMRQHAIAYLSLPERAHLVAIAELDRERGEAARKAFGFPRVHQDFQSLLDADDIDVISICTRSNTHTKLVRDALAAGKHVLCEKPMAATLAEADEMIAACDRYPNSKTSFLFQWRTDPGLIRLRDMIEGGHLGRLVMADLNVRSYRPAERYASDATRGSWAVDGGGMLIDVAIHQLDALIWLLGPPVAVSAQMDTFLRPIETEDTLVAWIRFESGALCTVRCTICEHERDNFTIDVLGEHGSVHLVGRALGRHPSHRACTWKLVTRDPKTRARQKELGFDRSPPLARERSYLRVRIEEKLHQLRGRPWLPPKHWWHTPCVEGFLEAVQTNRPVAVPPREARRSLEVVSALYQSALQRSAVFLPLDAKSPIYAGAESLVQPKPNEDR